MQILSLNNTQTPTSKGLVPMSDFKGPVLKLTKKEKERIAKLEQAILDNEHELYLMSRYRDLKQNWTEKDQYVYSFGGLGYELNIKRLKSEIQRIKLNRINKQRENATKKAANLDTIV